MVSVQGGQDLSISYQKQNCFSHGEGSFKEPYTNSFTRNELRNFRLMVLETSALIYGFLLYINPVKVQCYRITHVHNYYSIPSATILWKILYLIAFGHVKPDFVRYLFWICLKSQQG